MPLAGGQVDGFARCVDEVRGGEGYEADRVGQAGIRRSARQRGAQGRARETAGPLHRFANA